MLLLIPGPVQTRPETRAAMAQDIAPWDNDFRPVYAEIREMVRDIAGGVPGEHATMPLQGCGHFILEAAIRTFVPAGGTVLVPHNGAYADRAIRLATEAGRQVVSMPCPDTEGVSPAAIGAALAANPSISHVVMVHNETGSGIINDPGAVGPVVRAAGRRMILDSVSAFGALPFALAAHPEVDALVFTSGKCLEALPGSGYAVARTDRLLDCAGNAGSWSFDLSDIYQQALRAGWGSIRFTPAVQSLAAFRVALDFFMAEGGQPARLARYRENARILHEGVRSLGLTPYLDWAHQGPVIVTVHQPADPAFALQPFVDALKRRGVLISNFYNTRAPSFRVGCIGAIGPEDMRQAVAAIGGALDELGVRDRAARMPAAA
ncbi:2-aminoethylphosphonate--pyruvate transaminase [Paracraurococcus ruber]|uniref:2-aminoethylphosphonate--pyruvate transaminase n=1 Tax=Paracraurococcus ruber TaxID=77675 RepID=A0ABS1D365_9PROT|nr:2-aminoethylphosphonate--pyruvate transaminase [Paracraurococcus ruber]MBK1660527.1 2-aminoethylphosphonate--pyruvate transaminase [Paracraurococcus ruber]TDG31213.1 2-aminoethylphosphonate--pyruvate transaminase [Paracraurococcus ruber]